MTKLLTYFKDSIISMDELYEYIKNGNLSRGELYSVACDRWGESMNEDVRGQMSRVAAASAWAMGEWTMMEAYTQSVPRDTYEGAFYRAVLTVHKGQYHLAQQVGCTRIEILCCTVLYFYIVNCIFMVDSRRSTADIIIELLKEKIVLSFPLFFSFWLTDCVISQCQRGC